MTGILLGVSFIAGMILGVWVLPFVALIALLLVVQRRTPMAIAILAIALTIVGVLRAPGESRADIELSDPPVLIGNVSSNPEATRLGQRFVLELVEGAGDTPVRICTATQNMPPVEMGALVRASGQVVPLEELSTERRHALEAQGCQATLVAEEVVLIEQPDGIRALINDIRSQLSTFFQAVAPGDPGALMTGLVIGDDSALTYETSEAFIATGTTHITAVSGANFAILVTLASMLAGSGSTRRNWYWILGLTSAIWFYALLVGLPPSALRAAVMATLALMAARAGRIPDFLTLLVVTMVLQLAVRPGDLNTLSFQLSIAATLALILVFSGWSRSKPRLAIAVVVSATAAHLATAPILAYHLGVIPVGSIPANAMIFPLVVVAFYSAAASGALSFVLQGLASIVALPAIYASNAIVAIVSRLSALGGDQVETGYLPNSALLIMTAICWGTIMLLSRDCRVAAAHWSAAIKGRCDTVRVRMGG